MTIRNTSRECMACSSQMALRFGEEVLNHWRCARCGLESICPQPSDTTLAEIYQASYFSHYLAGEGSEAVRKMKRATYEHQLRRLPRAEQGSGRHRLLDCGAATGFLAELATELGWEVFAIEISEHGAQSCVQLLGRDHVYRGEVQGSQFIARQQGGFEIITMFDFIEHVRDPRAVLKWARRQLSGGGILLLTTPRVGSLSWRLMGRHWFHYIQEHLWFFSPKSIRMLLEQAGFRNIEVHALRKNITVGYMLAYYARRTTRNKWLSPAAGVLDSILPAAVKRQGLWFYLGEMVVLAHP